jgi:adenosylcobinamide-GDP ribazoletransferase
VSVARRTTSLPVALCTALTFLTRLPWVHRYAAAEPAALAASAWLWPLVGFLLAALQIALLALLQLCMVPHSVAIVVLLAFSVLLTGAFHEDGFADTADGFWGGYTAARRLEIMKDSRLGTYGTVALLLLFALKAALLFELLTLGSAVLALALSLAHIWSRASSVVLPRWLPYVREGASNKPIAEGFSLNICVAGLVLALSLSIGVGALARTHSTSNTALLQLALILAIVLPLLWWLSGLLTRAKIGGITGDVLGAINQLTELAVLFACLMVLRH